MTLTKLLYLAASSACFVLSYAVIRSFERTKTDLSAPPPSPLQWAAFLVILFGPPVASISFLIMALTV